MGNKEKGKESRPAGYSRRRFLKQSALATAGMSLSAQLLAACGDDTATSVPVAATTRAATAATTAAAAGGATTSAATPAAVGAATTSAATVSAVSGPALRLGVVLPFSGVYAQLGADIVDGMSLYFEGAGNVLAGRKVELLKEDEENDPAIALRKTKKLVESDKADMLTGIVSSAVALGLRDYVTDSKNILIISNAGARDVTGAKFSKYIFRTSFSNGQQVFPLGEWVYKNLAKNVFISCSDYVGGREYAEAFKTTFVQAGGKIAGEQYPAFGKTSDYAPFLQSIQAAKPEAVYVFYAGVEAVNFVKQYDQFGLKKDIPLIGSGFLVEEDTLPGQGASALGVKTALHYAYTLDTPENKKFVADFQAKYKHNPSIYALQGFDTARFIDEGLKVTKGDTTNKEALIKALEGIKYTSPRGPIEVDLATHGLTQNVYLRDTVAGPDGKPQPKVIQTFERVADINTLLKK